MTSQSKAARTGGAMSRILSTPLIAETRGGMSSVRVAKDKFHVATISAGMNDRSEYANLFTVAPKMLEALERIKRECIDIFNKANSHDGGHSIITDDLARIGAIANSAIAAAKGGAA